MYRNGLKRVFDFVTAVAAFVLLSPFFLVLCVLIKLDSPGPIFFTQRRIGKDKREFLILKFRSMRIDTPKNQPTHLLKNPNEYITKLGRFLRRSSFDELPQLLNIIVGHMSIVGPRPALYNQYDLIKMRDARGANAVRPGLTGWAQVNGRDELPVYIKSRYDAQYIEQMSFLFDLKCIIKTFKSVSTADGVVEGRPDVKVNSND